MIEKQIMCLQQKNFSFISIDDFNVRRCFPHKFCKEKNTKIVLETYD